ncbi:hypothetical protein [uncultured Zoogloea sp.]|uniref:polysaccharide deacetylase family protein n=1 Tax=uncultured Zoogloea sp. TaxID=160237 RepID=UPI002602098A|nr:hypothetical protein [uncultured Zoogloea sp.]
MPDPVKVYLTFDIEVWCGGWKDLDAKFPASFERYVYGRSSAGDYALPKTLEILDRNGLKGVFFVEPLFAARFGVEHLATIVDLIRAGGHDVQLHLHPEWSDELRPLPFPGANRKRQHLAYYTLEEQTILIRKGLDLMAQVDCHPIAFRAGSFAASADTFRALEACGLGLDFSLNEVSADSAPDLRGQADFLQPSRIGAVKSVPMTIFRDGTGRLRPAQLGSCSVAELEGALESTRALGIGHFVLLSHNFEMLKQGRSSPDGIVVRRFEKLCKLLAARRDEFTVSTTAMLPTFKANSQKVSLPSVGLPATLWRFGEQAARRFIG